MKRGTFTIDGVNSESLKTYIQDRPLLEVPPRKVEWLSIYGGDGQVPFDEGAYDNTTLELTLVTDGNDLIGDRQKLVELMDTRGAYKEMIPHFDPGKIYRFMMNDKMKFENKYYYGNVQASSVNLSVKPYKYLLGDNTNSFTTKEFTMTNPTNYTSQPIMKVEGSGDVAITVNGVPFRINDLPTKITIDSERYLAYTEGATGPLESMNKKIVDREYPIFKPGVNTIELSGDVTNVDVNPRWRSLV